MIKVTYEKLMRVYSETAELVMRKNTDYKDSWQHDGIIGLTVRIKDKLNRIENLSDGSQALVADEKIEDTARDLIGYAALLMLSVSEKKEHDPD